MTSRRRVAPGDAAEMKPSGFVATLKALRRRFGLDRHRLMERFTLTTAAFALSLVAITSGAVAVSVAKQAESLSTKPIYTREFSSSRSNIDGHLLDLTRSPDGSRAVVWMQMSSMDSMSVDANTYKVYVTGGTLDGKVTRIDQQVSGRFVVYGSTGVMAIVLEAHNADGGAQAFGSELMAITVRAYRELASTTAGDGTDPAKVEGADSFDLYDQWRLFENPGAAGATVDSSLAASDQDFDAVGAYRRQVVSAQVAAIRTTAQAQLSLLRVDQARITEYSQRAAAARYGKLSLKKVTPPATITGDSVIGNQGALRFTPATVIAGGYDFAITDDEDLSGYARAVPSTTGEVSPSMWSMGTTWRLSNGKTLDRVTGVADAAGVRGAVANLVAAWSTYYDHKRSYQVEVLGSLVSLAKQQAATENAISTNLAAVRTY